MLEYEGHQVVTDKHGRDALVAAASASKPFDLVVLDISMPEMSGIEVAQALRPAPKTADIYIVVHTGLDEHWVRERLADYDVYLTKAADAEALVEQIARLLAHPKSVGGRRTAKQSIGADLRRSLPRTAKKRPSRGGPFFLFGGCEGRI